MNAIYKQVKGDKIIKWGMSLALFLFIVESFFLLFFYRSLPPVVPLFNQMPWGESTLGTRVEIFLPILIGIIFFILNFFLVTRFYEKMPLLSRMLGITTLLIFMLLLVFVLRTLQLIL